MDLSPVKRNKHGEVIHSDKRKSVINLYKSVRGEGNELSKDSIVDKVARFTGISKRSVYRIISAYDKNKTVESPKNRKKRSTIIEKVDCFDKCAIRRKVHEFLFRNEPPTVNKILKVVNEDEQLPNFKRSTLHKLLTELNFKFCKRRRNAMLSDRDDIILWRRKYLRSIKQCREEGKKIYYLDETWLNEGYVTSKVWTDTGIESVRSAFMQGLSTGLKIPTGKGQRLIITHIGSEEGFLPDGLSMFTSKRTGDYHEDMDGDEFITYFIHLLSLLEEGSVIVLDNAPYHSVKLEEIPNSNWNKPEILKWLLSKGLKADITYLKKELLDLVKSIRNKYDKYVIDELAKEQNKRVLRIPPYHCELNPIELGWAYTKIYVAGRNSKFKLSEIASLFEAGLQTVTPELWRKWINHVKKEEDKLWELDNVIENYEELAPMIINLDEDSDTTNDSDLASELQDA